MITIATIVASSTKLRDILVRYRKVIVVYGNSAQKSNLRDFGVHLLLGALGCIPQGVEALAHYGSPDDKHLFGGSA